MEYLKLIFLTVIVFIQNTCDGDKEVPSLPENVAPTVESFSVSTNSSESVAFTLRGSDDNGDTLTYIIGSADSGNAVLTGDMVTFTPVAGFSGTVSLSYVASDGSLNSNDGIVSITVNAVVVSTTPTVLPLTVNTMQGTSFTFTLTATDNKDSIEDLTFDIGTPNSGIATLDGNVVSYRPNFDFVGDDTLTYTVTNSSGLKASGLITITIEERDDSNSPPTAQNISATISVNTSIDLTLVVSDAEDGSSLTINLSAPDNGAAILIDGIVTYTPNTNFIGLDSLFYTVTDSNGATTVATIEVTVFNNLPVIANQSITIAENTVANITLTASDIDQDNDQLVFSIAQPNNGQVLQSGSLVTYTPNTDYSGTDVFAVTVTDLLGASATALVNITIDYVNRVPIAFASTKATDEDAAVVITLSATDAEQTATELSYSVSTPTFGTIVVVGNDIIYTPIADKNGIDQFIFRVTDNAGASATALITVDVIPQPDAPIANGQSLQLNEGESLTITLTATDADGDTDLVFDFDQTNKPNNGSVSLNGNTVIYTPKDTDFNGLDDFGFIVTDKDGNGLTSNPAQINLKINAVNDPPTLNTSDYSVSFNEILNFDLALTDIDGDTNLSVVAIIATLTVSDGTTQTNFVLYFTVIDTELPVASVQAISLLEDSSTTTQLVAIDPDGDDNNLIYSISTNRTDGTVMLVGDMATYTPDEDYNGSDQFSFRVTDEDGAWLSP